MKKHPLATVISFCSNEIRYIGQCIEQALVFSSQVIVPVCDHFYDGTEEDLELLQKLYSAYPNVQFIEFPYVPEDVPMRMWKKIKPANFWHCMSRLVGFSNLHESIESILFLDADEIVDAERMQLWLDASDYKFHTVLKLANYWYFRDLAYQAKTFEDSAVLVQKKAIDPEIFLKQDERNDIYNLLPGPKRRQVFGCDGQPMIHHYSWVRSKEEMLKKVKSFGQKEDRDWVSLVKKEFESNFSGTDFVHGYKYNYVNPFCKIDFEIPVFHPKGDPCVKKISAKDLLKLIKFKKFWNFLDF